MDRVLGRASISLLVLLLCGSASAVGLGELRGQPVLGEGLRVEVILLGAEQQRLDASCFRLLQPTSTDDLPWVRKASLAVRRGAATVLEIRSEVPLREPIMQMRVALGCGHEISRDYVLMASPAREATASAAPVRRESYGSEPPARPVERRPARIRPAAPPAVEEAPVRLAPRLAGKRRVASDMPDRLVLSGDDGVGSGEPSLRLATELLSATVAKETQRDILRLEYRMLMALHEQAASQMATAEKLRDMEGTLVELQARTSEFAQRIEKEASVQGQAQPASPAPVAVAPGESPAAVAEKSQARPFRVNESAGDTSWSLYGLAAGMLFGLAAWFGWRKYREAKDADSDTDPFVAIPEVRIDPQRHDEYSDVGGVDLHFEPATGKPMSVDVELDDKAHHSPVEPIGEKSAQPVSAPDSVLSINSTTLDEHFEVNPVMELADIMLSFGRVKGAAQALQEFIDHNPEEALQPWIRLMEVYRMAGMRTEFESVASNLNQHFNVEVQGWESGPAEVPDEAGVIAAMPRPQSLEDMPRLTNAIIDLWDSGDVVGYLYQLLRDNRGGQRQGFTMPVVDDILFLIELKETANRME